MYKSGHSVEWPLLYHLLGFSDLISGIQQNTNGLVSVSSAVLQKSRMCVCVCVCVGGGGGGGGGGICMHIYICLASFTECLGTRLI